MKEGGFKYLAFISYARADNERPGRLWADWLTRLIESFPVDGRPRKVFLDREVLPAGGDLSPMLESHLAGSKFLILICSPKSAGSRWVGNEVDFFRKHRGVEFIIPVVIRGNDPDLASSDLWISGNHRDLALRTYADFRTHERQRNQTDLIEEGWTSTAAYRGHLAKRKAGSKTEIEDWSKAYEERHKVAKYAILSQLFDLTPLELERIDRDHQGRTAYARVRRIAWILAFIAIVSGAATWVSLAAGRRAKNEQLKAERERMIAERALMLISDAHEGSTRMIVEVLTGLVERMPNGEREAVLAEARRIVDEGLEQSIAMDRGEDQLHMRAVILDSRGHLAAATGDLAVATGHYSESLDLREELRGMEPGNSVFLHNLAVSHDNLGDCHVLAAGAPGISPERIAELLKLAEAEYRESVEISRSLATKPDAINQWRHDLAVGLFKLGDTLANREDEDLRGKAAESLREGMIVAADLARRDPGYPKWQAHLGLFCLRLGRIHALAADDKEARRYFDEGRAIFVQLRDRKQLIRQYASWLDEIEKCLSELG